MDEELKQLYKDMDELETTLGIVTELGHLDAQQISALNIRVRNLIDLLNGYQAEA
jgi:hypothetical protein